MYYILLKSDKHNWFMLVMKAFPFENNKKNPSDRLNQDCNRVWKIRRIFNYINNTYSTLYQPTKKFGIQWGNCEIEGYSAILAVHTNKA